MENDALRHTLDSKCQAVEIFKSAIYSNSESGESCADIIKQLENMQTTLIRLQSELALANGQMISSKNAYERRVEELTKAGKTLVDQLQEAQDRADKLRSENIRLLLYVHNSTRMLGDNCVSPEQTSVNHNVTSSQKFALSSFPLSAEAFLETLEQNWDLETSSHASYELLGSNDESSDSPPFSNYHSTTELWQPDWAALEPERHQKKDQGKSKKESCKCASPTLCPCALVGIRLQRKLLNCTQQLANMSKQTNELLITVEAYRMAIESQFKRCSDLSELFSRLFSRTSEESTSIKMTQKSPRYPESEQKTIFDLDVDRLSESLHGVLQWFYKNLKYIEQNLFLHITTGLAEKKTRRLTPARATSSSIVSRGFSSSSLAEDCASLAGRVTSADIIDYGSKSPTGRRSYRQITLGSQRQINKRRAKQLGQTQFKEKESFVEDHGGPDPYSRRMSCSLERVASMSTVDSGNTSGYRPRKNNNRVESIDSLSVNHKQSIPYFMDSTDISMDEPHVRLAELLPKVNELYQLLARFKLTLDIEDIKKRMNT